MSFDHAVSRAVTMAHALEKALHDAGPWEIELDGMIVPAQRIVRGWAVEFIAHFPYVSDDAIPVLLCQGERVRACAPVSGSDGPFEYRLELSLPAGVSA